MAGEPVERKRVPRAPTRETPEEEFPNDEHDRAEMFEYLCTVGRSTEWLRGRPS